MALINRTSSPVPYARNLHRVAASAACSIVLCASVLIFGTGCTGGTPDLDAFKEAIAEEKIIQEGVALDDYVNPSGYEITAFNMSDPETEDGVTSTNGTVTIENESFSTQFEVKARYEDDAYSFDITPSTTTPIAGIDFDEEHGIEDADSELTDENTCKVVIPEEHDFWFASTSTNLVYTYEFNNGYWEFKGESRSEETATAWNADAINGSYAFSGNAITTFEISDFDADKGTFTLHYAPTNETGTIECTISSYSGNEAGENALENGYSYAFSGTDGDIDFQGTFSAEDNTLQVSAWLPHEQPLDNLGITVEVYETESGTLTKM